MPMANRHGRSRRQPSIDAGHRRPMIRFGPDFTDGGRVGWARETGMAVSLVAGRHGVAPNQLFTWRRLVAQGSLTAAGSGEEVVPASDYRALQNQVRELHRLLGKKTLEAEILKEALEHATGFARDDRMAF